MKNENSYKRVSCNFYDELEKYATLRQHLQIKYLDEQENIQVVQAKIKDLQTKDKAEFLILDNNLKIRLDKIISIKPISLLA